MLEVITAIGSTVLFPEKIIMRPLILGLSTTPVVTDIKSQVQLQIERDLLALVYRTPGSANPVTGPIAMPCAGSETAGDVAPGRGEPATLRRSDGPPH